MSNSAEEQPRDNGRDVDILGSFEHLKEALFRYYNTPFGLADQHLEEERQALFDADGGAWRRPLLEVRPRYTTVDAGIAESVRSAGAHPDLAELVQLGLLRGVPSLYEHQHRALGAAVRDGRDHNPFGFTMWLAGGGVKGGMAYGATDEYGFHAVENKVEGHDLHATMLHLLGLDHKPLT